MEELMLDPTLLYNPFKRHVVREARKCIKELRDYGREHILKRIKDIENGEPTPNDILSAIINNPRK